MKTALILCMFFSFGFSEILSLSSKEKRAMKNDFAVLDNAFNKEYDTPYFVEFAEKFLETYKLASVDRDKNYRNLYGAVQNAITLYNENKSLVLPQVETDEIEDIQMQKLFSSILLSPAEDIIAFAHKYPDYREKDIYGALERARVTDLSLILTTISRSSIPVNEIVRYSQIYGDTVSLVKIKIGAEKSVLKDFALLPDYRRVFGVTEFDEKAEQFLYSMIMSNSNNKNLIAYLTYYPEGKYVRFVNELANSIR